MTGRHMRAVGAAVVHPVELLDWATGGPRPTALDVVVARMKGAEAAAS